MQTINIIDIDGNTMVRPMTPEEEEEFYIMKMDEIAADHEDFDEDYYDNE